MQAYAYAWDKHSGQLRADGSPYFGHVERVRNIIAEFPGVSTSMLNACYCHDLQEDCGVTNKEIEDLFGEETALYVEELTSPDSQYPETVREKMSRVKKKKLMIEKLIMSSDEARLIKMADRLDNIRSALSSGRGFRWVQKYYNETIDLIDFVFAIPNKYKEAQAELNLALHKELMILHEWLEQNKRK